MATTGSQPESGDEEQELGIRHAELIEYSGGRQNTTTLTVSREVRGLIEEAATRVNLEAGANHPHILTHYDVVELILQIAKTAELNGDLGPTEEKLAGRIQDSLQSGPNPFREQLMEWGINQSPISRLMRNGYTSLQDIREADPEEMLTIPHIGDGTVRELKQNIDEFGEMDGEARTASPEIEVEEAEVPEEHGCDCPHCPAVKPKSEIAPHIAAHEEFDGETTNCPLCSRQVPKDRYGVHLYRCQQ